MKPYGLKRHGQFSNKNFSHGCQCGICRGASRVKGGRVWKHKFTSHRARRVAKEEIAKAID